MLASTAARILVFSILQNISNKPNDWVFSKYSLLFLWIYCIFFANFSVQLSIKHTSCTSRLGETTGAQFSCPHPPSKYVSHFQNPGVFFQVEMNVCSWWLSQLNSTSVCYSNNRIVVLNIFRNIAFWLQKSAQLDLKLSLRIQQARKVRVTQNNSRHMQLMYNSCINPADVLYKVIN